MATRAIAATALSALALAACDESGDEAAVPGGADPDAVDVIRDWADQLRAGDVEAAAYRFEIPATVQNGTPPLRLTDRDQLVAFNESLPCGAVLTEAERSGQFTIATFELTERPGPGECGPGVGETARTAFVIHDGRIAEWRRVADEQLTEPPSQGPVV